MDTLTLLEKIEDIVEEASKFPLSNKVMVDKEEILEIIKDIRMNLPDELSSASWVTKERPRILAEAQAEAQAIINESKQKQYEMIDENEITKYAKQQAAIIMEEAEKKEAEMKKNAYEYSDNMLQKLQEEIIYINKTIEENRAVLKNM